jgi:hypothetical protein
VELGEFLYSQGQNRSLKTGGAAPQDVVTEPSEVVDGQVEHEIGFHIPPMSVVSTVGIIMVGRNRIVGGGVRRFTANESADSVRISTAGGLFLWESADSLRTTTICHSRQIGGR